MNIRYRDQDHRRTGWRHELLHLLHNPASLGRQEPYRVRFPLLHRIHLIPANWLDRACDRYDARHDGHRCTLYYCPTVGEVESACHGGFDVCCGHPELHQPVDERTTPNNPPASSNTVNNPKEQA